jgi:DNA-directed RNA polymerase II subunit RPB1
MTRLLTNEEIDNILDFIKPNPNIPIETGLSVIKKHKQLLKEQLINEKIYPEIIPELKKKIKYFFETSLIQAGESVGVICAQSIGEKQTQTTLNTFHKAGQSEKTMTMGVPRFQELINATKKPKIVNHKIFFKNNTKSITTLRNYINHQIVGLRLKDLISEIEIKIDKNEEIWYKSFRILYGVTEKYDNCLSIKLNMNKLYEYKITMNYIANFINNKFDDIYCVFSSVKLGKFDIFVDTNNLKLPEERLFFINSNNAVEIYLEEVVQPLLENLILCGIEGITEIFYIKEKDNWVIETNGINSRIIKNNYINYKKLLALNIVDFEKTLSNNVWDIYEVLGIEAAREFLINEFINIMEGINLCHAYLLVDRMTHNGNISSITRYTMKKEGSGPFGRASFEETMDNFLNAASRGEIEPTEGVSASIICGKLSSIGTGIPELELDIESIIGK